MVASVRRIVTAGSCEVDAADEGYVAAQIVAVPDHHELLVVAAQGTHPVVGEELTTGGVHCPDQSPVLPCSADQPRRMGSPHQSLDHDAVVTGTAQRLVQGEPLVGEDPVGVDAPADEEHQVTGCGVLERVGEGSELGPPVDQGTDGVAGGPGSEVGGVVIPLGTR